MEKSYRKNVAAVVVNQQGLILACQRSDISGAWQIPQGGMKKGETPEQTLHRELLEEIGTDDFTVIGQLEKAIRYDWPEHLHSKKYHGQEQVYFLVRLLESACIDLNADEKPEFRSYEWVSAKEFFSRISGFKAAAYKNGIQQLSDRYPNIIHW